MRDDISSINWATWNVDDRDAGLLRLGIKEGLPRSLRSSAAHPANYADRSISRHRFPL